MNQSEFNSALDLVYEKLKTIKDHVKKELKEFAHAAHVELHKAMKLSDIVEPDAPIQPSIKSGSPLQQDTANRNIYDIIKIIENCADSIAEESTNSDVKESLNNVVSHLEKSLQPIVEKIEEKAGETESGIQIVTDPDELAKAELEFKSDPSAEAVTLSGEVIDVDNKTEIHNTVL